MLNGEKTQCTGEATVELWIDGNRIVNRCLVAPMLVSDSDVILGMDIITRMGGVFVGKDSSVTWKSQSCAVGALCAEDARGKMKIEDKDFTAMFDGHKWVVEWKWLGAEPQLKNRCASYAVAQEHQEEYDREVEQWIAQGWLQPYSARVHGKVYGVIPLMAASQPNKPKKVRPVMDYRELNQYVRSHPGQDTVVCQEKLRAWRMRGNKVAMLDLKKAYLQVHVAEYLMRFQAVIYKERLYVMTRMGFGLNVAPKIMSRIISAVLALDDQVKQGTDHYLDDIWIDKEVVTPERVRQHLQQYGLVTKDPESLVDTRVLGLRVIKNQAGCLVWKRDGELPSLTDIKTKRELFSVCGKLVGHYPVASWLRVACSYIKRLTNDSSWDDILPANVELLIGELSARLSDQDPATGRWMVDKGKAIVWCDVSSLAIGCSLQVNDDIVEDGAWLRKENDGAHINVAELEAVLKGLNLAIRWGLTDVKLMTDSASVYGWVRSILEDTKRPRASGLSEMIIKRRLGTISQLIDEYGLDIDISLVPSARNLADTLTRVPRKWLHKQKVCLSLATSDDGEIKRAISDSHNQHHLGVDRTLFIAQRTMGMYIDKGTVEQVVASCHRCKSVDPSPVKWDHGQLSVDAVWLRLAVDVAFVNGKPYLTLIDCGPSRYAIWMPLTNETADSVIKQLTKVFQERGPPMELLMDNGACFTSSRTTTFLKIWGVTPIYCCAYRHAGNGIVERNHRTIKRMVARAGGDVAMMVYWYNNSPNSDGVVPSQVLHKYEARLLGESTPDGLELPASLMSRRADSNLYHVGDMVYVKPGNARCNTQWRRGMVKKVVADNVVEIDGMNRHVADVRPVDDDDVSEQPRDNDNRGVEIECKDNDINLVLANEGDYDNENLANEGDDDNDNMLESNSYAADASTSAAETGDDPDTTLVDRPVRDRRPPKTYADYLFL